MFSLFFLFLISTSCHNTTNYLSLTQQQQDQEQQPPVHLLLRASSSTSSTLPPSLPPTTLLLLPLYMYIHCFSEMRRIILEYYFVRDYASRDQIYHFINLALRNTTVRTRTALEYYTTTSNISENNNFFCNY